MPENSRKPEELLSAIQKLENKSSRGNLRIFLGMCPGVGKTYAMLKAAIDQKSRGKHVMIGVVETHKRKDTLELVSHLPVISKKEFRYKNTVIEEMDLDSILKAKPDLVLVDELAHTNAEGSRHQKRYQDVDEILDAGIDVYTTMNVQHIESRNDQVVQITGVVVRETVPDSFLEKADQIQMIDLSVQDLLTRLSEGKVYLGEGAKRAAQNFFKEEHLTALRELALRFTAEIVDQDLQHQMTLKGIEGPWNTNERLLVAVSHSPYSNRLIRAARRMAYNLEAPWIALYVDTGAFLNAEDQSTLRKNLDLAKELGAEVVTLTDSDLVGCIQQVCEQKNVTQIIMGRPDKRFFRDLFLRGTALDQLVSQISKIDIHVIRAERKPIYKDIKLEMPQMTSTFVTYYKTIWFMIAVGIFCQLMLPMVGYRALGSIYLIAILTVSIFATRGPIVFSAIIGALSWNYFFMPPRFTFIISANEDVMMLLIFFITATVSGFLTTKIRRQEETLKNRQERMGLLYELSRALADVNEVSKIIKALSSTIESQFQAKVEVLLSDKDQQLNNIKRDGLVVFEKDYAVADWSFRNNKLAGWSTPTLSASNCLCLPMLARSGNIGITLFYPTKDQKNLTLEEQSFLETVISQAAVAIERLILTESAQQAKLLQESEKLHQVLLNSVSHELRTPITAIIGTATALKEESILKQAEARESLTNELINSSKRLDRVVENLLDVSRLDKDKLVVRAEWFDIFDLLHQVKSDLREELVGKSLQITGASVLIEGDFRLLEHAIRNLVLNASKYSSSDATIEIRISLHKDILKIQVVDDGKGFPTELSQQIFEKFFRVAGTAPGGLGLGLSLVKNIIELHKGSVVAYNRIDLENKSGAIFEIKLPYKAPPETLKGAIDG